MTTRATPRQRVFVICAAALAIALGFSAVCFHERSQDLTDNAAPAAVPDLLMPDVAAPDPADMPEDSLFSEPDPEQMAEDALRFWQEFFLDDDGRPTALGTAESSRNMLEYIAKQHKDTSAGRRAADLFALLFGRPQELVAAPQGQPKAPPSPAKPRPAPVP